MSELVLIVINWLIGKSQLTFLMLFEGQSTSDPVAALQCATANPIKFKVHRAGQCRIRQSVLITQKIDITHSRVFQPVGLHRQHYKF